MIERRKPYSIRRWVDAEAALLQARGMCGRVADEHGERVICTELVPCEKHDQA